MENIFLVKSVEFDHQKEDPFGFDAIAEKVASKYISFSGSIRKPIYILFVLYVEELIKANRINSNLKKNLIKIRLEKLFVHCIKEKFQTRGLSIIGSSLNEINPFEGKDGNWVVQNCYKIYDNSAKKFELRNLIEQYIRRNSQEINLLNEFFSKSGRLKNNKQYLDYIVKKLKAKSYSIFNGNHIIHESYKPKFIKSLKQIILNGNFKFKDIDKNLFTNINRSEKEIIKILNSNEYPFHVFNKWVSSYIKAVDAEINNEPSIIYWKNADNDFDNLITNENYKNLQKRIKPNCWFRFENNKYKITDNFNSSGWNSLVRRANQHNSLFYDFKTNALKSLIKESL